MPKGVSMPVFTLQGSQNGNDFALFGQNISQKDQRYTGLRQRRAGSASAFDYNQIVAQHGEQRAHALQPRPPRACGT